MILIRVHGPESTLTHRVEMFPALLGRAMHCGVCIDEPSVSAQHAELHVTEEGYTLTDLHSTNGLYRGQERLLTTLLQATDTLYLGDVRVDFITADQLEKTTVKKVLPGSATNPPGHGTPVKIGAALAAAFAVLVLVAASDQYQIYWPPERPTDLLSKAIQLWAGVVLAALLVSLFCKLNAKRFYFYQVLLLMTAAAVAAKACYVLSPTVVFNLQKLPLVTYGRPLGYGLITIVFSLLLQRYVFPAVSKAQRIGVALIAAVLTLVSAQVFLERRSSGERPTMAEVGFDLRPALDLKPNADDLFFDLALSVAAVDHQRIKILEALEAEHSGD